MKSSLSSNWFQCPHCPSAFDDRASLNNHVEGHKDVVAQLQSNAFPSDDADRSTQKNADGKTAARGRCSDRQNQTS